jgi:DNA-binding transcriptional regulator YhcF (GntR family)
MDFMLSRRGPATVQAQLAAQIEIKILAGEYAAAQKLPSVRALARRLNVHPNTVSTVYQRLTRDGWLEREQGSGLYVRRGAPSEKGSAEGLEDVLRSALHRAFRQGFSAADIRGGIERWLAAPPPRQVVVVETNRATADVLVHEIRERVGGPVSACLLETALSQGLPPESLAVTWPFHLEPLRRVVPEDALAPLTLRVSAEDARTITRLPKDSVALVLSHSTRVLQYAEWMLNSVRGDDIMVRCVQLGDEEEWRALLPAVEAVFADALSVEAVRPHARRPVRELRLVSPESCAAIRQRLAFATPSLASPGALGQDA